MRRFAQVRLEEDGWLVGDSKLRENIGVKVIVIQSRPARGVLFTSASSWPDRQALPSHSPHLLHLSYMSRGEVFPREDYLYVATRTFRDNLMLPHAWEHAWLPDLRSYSHSGSLSDASHWTNALCWLECLI